MRGVCFECTLRKSEHLIPTALPNPLILQFRYRMSMLVPLWPVMDPSPAHFQHPLIPFHHTNNLENKRTGENSLKALENGGVRP